MSLNINDISIVHWCSDNEKHKCGYCKGERCSVSHGMWAEQLTVEDYQNLIDRGWRRSGKYCYKPTMKDTCCPLYTIRCNSLQFKPTKSQKKIIKKLNRFLKDGVLVKDLPNNSEDQEESSPTSAMFIKDKPLSNFNYNDLNQTITNCDIVETSDQMQIQVSAIKDKPIQNTSNLGDSLINVTVNSSDVAGSSKSNSTSSKEIKKGVGADPNKPPCKKAKQLRLERKQQKMQQNGMPVEKQPKNEEKNIEDYMNETSPDDKHQLKIVLVSTSNPGPEWDRTKNSEFEIYKKYQMVVHNDPPEKCSMASFTRFLVSSPLQIRLVRMSSKHKSFNISWRLYAKYQMSIHEDKESDCDQENFCDFLVDSPLQAVELGKDGEIGFGSFHQQYWLDDKLIAVGVIDILPRCVSSVYFFYDPDYRSLTLGTYGSLREIQFTKTLSDLIPNLQYYYMGFYVHSCPKMRYKGKLSPSDLLCPETYTWVPIGICLPKLDVNKYSRFNDNDGVIDENSCTSEDLNQIKILLGNTFCTFLHYKYRNRHASIFITLGDLVGKKCAHTLLVVQPN